MTERNFQSEQKIEQSSGENTAKKDLNSSMSTIFALVNTMIGGALLTFPVLFKSTGIISSLLVLLVSAFISHCTCRVYVMHMRDEDADVQSTIRRISGAWWQKLFRVLTGVYLLLLNIIYIDLVVDQTYSAIWFVFSATGHGAAIADPTAQVVIFDQFSIQYMAIIYFLPLLAMFFIRNIALLIRLAKYGVYAALIYFLFIIYELIYAVVKGNVNIEGINWFSWDLGNLPGGCALAFTIHTIVNSILKSNKEQKNNQRDLLRSYILGFALYALVSVMGTLAIQSRKCAHTIVDCYQNEWEVLLVEISYLLGRLTVLPVVLSISRTRLLQLFNNNVVKQNHVRNFNITFAAFATLFCILSPYLHIELVMNLVGSIVCYFFIYLIPTHLHFSALYRHSPQTNSLMGSITEDGKSDKSIVVKQESTFVKIGRIVLYTIINVIGVVIGGFGLYTCISNLIN